MSHNRLRLLVATFVVALSSLLSITANAVRVYFDNKDANWATPYCYCWDSNDKSYKSWPGEAMTLSSYTNIYSYDIPAGYTNVIFNNNNGTQTADLSVSANTVYTKDGSTGKTLSEYLDITDPDPQPFDVYFDNYESKWGQVLCYPYTDGTLTTLADYSMTHHDGSIYKMSVPAGTTQVKFIDGGTVYTGLLDAVADRVYALSGSTGKSISEWSTPILEDIFVYFEGTWENLYVYAYNENVSPTVTNASWPGEPMSYDAGTGLYRYSLPTDLKASCRVIINTNGGSNRYPADNQPGMVLTGKSMVFIANGSQWVAFDSYTPPGPGASNLGEFVSYTDNEGTVTVTGTTGTLYITPKAPEIVKIFTLKSDATATTERHSIGVIEREDPLFFYDLPEAEYTVDTDEDYLTVSIEDGVDVRVSKNTMLVTFLEDGVELLSESTGLVNASAGGSTRVGFASTGKASEAFYGGGYNGNRVNWKGSTMVMNNTQTGGWEQGTSHPHNICVPYYVSTSGYGVYFDSNYRGAKITPSTSGTTYTCDSPDPVSYYFLGGGTMEKAMQNYNHLTGHQNLPPYWALGYITSKYSFATDAEARATVTNTKNVNIPIDGIVFDIHWQGGSRGAYGMGYLDWNSTAFPKKEGLIKDLLNNEKVHSLAITEPFFNSAGDASTNYNLLKSSGWLADEKVTANGNMTWIGGGAAVGLIDASNPDAMAWFTDKYIPHTQKGMSAWWLDLGEPEAYNSAGDEANTHHYSGTPSQVHNEFGNLWTGAVYERLYTATEQLDADVEDGKQIKDLRHLTLPRAGSAGMQRYGAFPWTGDIKRSWAGLAAQVPALVSAAMSGISYLGSDIGGFTASGTNANLYRRWVQLGVFYPMMRTHSANCPEVWQSAYDGVRDDVRNAINMRYAYLPYLYTRAYDYTRYGTPIARPSNFGNADPTRNSDEIGSYLWGPDIFVAPVLTESNSKTINFPEGDWLDMNDFATIHEGYSSWSGNVPESQLPHFMRRGSFVPRYRQDTYTNTAGIQTDMITVDYFPLYGGLKNTGYFFEDDHKTVNTILKNEYLLTRFESIAYDNNNQNAIAINISTEGGGWTGMPATRDILIRIHDFRVDDGDGGSLSSSDVVIKGSGAASAPSANGPRHAAASVSQAESVNDVLAPSVSGNLFAQDGNTLYLRMPAVAATGATNVVLGSEDIFTGIERPAALAAMTFAFDGEGFTYSAPEGTETLVLEVYSTTGIQVARFDALEADGYAHRVAASLPAGIYIARLSGRTSAATRTIPLRIIFSQR